jgi:hypothetical protein
MIQVTVKDFALKVWAYTEALKAAGVEDTHTEMLQEMADSLIDHAQESWTFPRRKEDRDG